MPKDFISIIFDWFREKRSQKSTEAITEFLFSIRKPLLTSEVIILKAKCINCIARTCCDHGYGKLICFVTTSATGL